MACSGRVRALTGTSSPSGTHRYGPDSRGPGEFCQRGGPRRRMAEILRSVDKVVGLRLPELKRGTLIETVLQDQISAYHPSAALAVAPLLKAVGVFHAEPRLLVMPDDPRLGQFRDEFAGLLVLFEERPDEGLDDMVGPAGLSKSVGTERLFELLDQDPRHDPLKI